MKTKIVVILSLFLYVFMMNEVIAAPPECGGNIVDPDATYDMADGYLYEYRNLTQDTAYYRVTASASSEYNDNYAAWKIKDTVCGRWDEGEWATLGGREGSWIQLNWTGYPPHYMNVIKIYPRPNRFDQIYDATLIIIRGGCRERPECRTEIHLGKFSDGGAPKEIYLTEAEGTNVTELQVYITEVAPTTFNTGLAEIECFFNPLLWPGIVDRIWPEPVD